MPSASSLRLQIESALAEKIPAALTPQPNVFRPVLETGIPPLDDLLRGGLPIGALSELTGPECSGRTSAVLSFLARVTEEDKVCAWIDVSNAFDPASAASVGVSLGKLLWVRCGTQDSDTRRRKQRFVLPKKYLIPPPAKRGLHGGGFGPHPRTEARGLSGAVGDLFTPRCAEPEHRPRATQMAAEPTLHLAIDQPRFQWRAKQYDAIEQGLRSTDLLLQAGGFGAIVLDLASVAPKFVARIELSTWHRYRLAAERTQSSILLLTQYACAKSSSELQLKFFPAEEVAGDPTVFSGIQPRVEVVRQRFARPESNVVALRKPPQSVRVATWENRTTWSVPR